MFVTNSHGRVRKYIAVRNRKPGFIHTVFLTSSLDVVVLELGEYFHDTKGSELTCLLILLAFPSWFTRWLQQLQASHPHVMMSRGRN